MKPVISLALAAGALALLAGCTPEGEKVKDAAPVRPVLSIVVASASERQQGFAGTIQPQYQTDRGFRVLGRIIARNVDVGDVVKTGQMLAQIDPLVLDLAMRASEAELAKARAQLSNASAAEIRTGTLLGRQIANQADFDSVQQAREAAAASVQQSEANLTKAREQRSYATLTADMDGVVTSIDAEVGQTVSPGRKVMTLARTDIREAVVDLPDSVTRSLAVGAAFEIRLQADPTIKAAGRVREIAPQADAATRTRRVKVTLDQLVDAFRIGATITAHPVMAVEAAALEIPVSALQERDGAVRVWLVDPAARTVKTVPVEVAAREGDRARIANGISAGARIVVAGVNSLSEGQTVKIDEGTIR
ncbi:MAG: efflux RND transporter periplasmic adaptor subunit [Mesorhizobium sp.]|uniref:efflux RND transporter periplasmic adaptor subunit n=1 Tax=Mesorhizobium sp. TaxID=1871066 RepID=UPI000FE96A91|nr:efflux RND transporter periplasmic adaptor subunit [Mesorhizobium sp.]RWH94063.1 MAG: efflux RND transporter periplasmic adaptor subunit [Mesorhizobium sp.]RWK82693.1 MAG: efflux RND transporter periplasmic adaptor subunit [Mesorhizobium sp.]RWL06500.1 MAG: efflux RND transporter periplasmic adaptor subunit [Mesorhizobium sp.]